MAAAPAQLIITFTNIGIPDTTVDFTATGVVSLVCKDLRGAQGQWSKGTSAITAAENYEFALVTDVSMGLQVSRVDNVVTILGGDNETDFTNISIPIAYASYVAIPHVPADPFTVIASCTSGQGVVNPNVNCYARLTPINGTPDYIVYNIQQVFTDDNIFYQIARQGGSRFYDIEDDSGVRVTGNVPTIDLVSIESVVVVEAAEGATVSINAGVIQGDQSTVKVYSINGANYQASPQFTGLIAGTYTAYLQDDFAAHFTQEFTVAGGVVLDKPEPYFNIVKTNPLQFVNNELIGIPNLDNALFETIQQSGYFPNVEHKHYSQIIANGDNIVTQVRNNYDDVTVQIFDCETDEAVATPSFDLKVNSIAKEDDRDCTIRSASDGKAVVYFESGNIYNPDPQPYANPAGGLFAFAKLGKRFTISGSSASDGIFNPIESYFDISLNQWGIKLDVTYAGTINGDFARCLTVYDERQYNTYEFSTSFADLTLGQTYYTKTTATDPDPRYDPVEWISEPLTAISDVSNTTIFDYRNAGEDTAGIDFTTGVTLRLRVYGRFMRGNNSLDIVNPFTSDTGKKVILKSISTRFVKFESMPMPYYSAEKISILSGMDTLNINEHPYAIDESEEEDFVDENNPFIKVVYTYQDNDTITISDTVGISTQTQQVIGSSLTIAIGDQS